MDIIIENLIKKNFNNVEFLKKIQKKYKLADYEIVKCLFHNMFCIDTEEDLRNEILTTSKINYLKPFCSSYNGQAELFSQIENHYLLQDSLKLLQDMPVVFQHIWENLDIDQDNFNIWFEKVKNQSVKYCLKLFCDSYNEKNPTKKEVEKEIEKQETNEFNPWISPKEKNSSNNNGIDSTTPRIKESHLENDQLLLKYVIEQSEKEDQINMEKLELDMIKNMIQEEIQINFCIEKTKEKPNNVEENDIEFDFMYSDEDIFLDSDDE